MAIHSSVLELIGETPIVKAQRLDTGVCELYLKLESANPGGSIKDRIGLSMIEAAEQRGDIKPGDTLVEGTAGNTGIGLALVAQQKGYKLVLVVPDKMSREKIFNLKAMGAEVVLTRSDVAKGHPEYYQDLAARIASETPGAYFINQFGNPDNPAAHEFGTGPEILRQMDGQLDAIVFGCGSSGTMTGLSRCFRRARPARGTDPGRSGRLDPHRIHQRRHAQRKVRQLDGGRHRRGLPAADLRLHPGEEGLRDQRQGKLPDRARTAGEGRHPRRLLHRHPAGGGAEVLQGADHAEEGAGVRLRHRQQVPVEDVQRLLDARQRFHRARPARRPARPDPAPLQPEATPWWSARPTC